MNNIEPTNSMDQTAAPTSSDQLSVDHGRRSFFGGAATGGLALAGAIGVLSVLKSSPAEASGITGWYDVKADFIAVGDGNADDTTAFENAIAAGSSNQKPIFVPPGNYRITRALTIPPNTMIIGSNEGLGFGCLLSPDGCAAFDIGGSSMSWACSIENLMIWPRGAAPDHVISIDNSYSIVLRNIRIHTAAGDSWNPTTATIVLKGDPALGGTGHGHSNNIIWENIVVRSDDGQPSICVLAQSGCGTHRFIAPDLENYVRLFVWRGGNIDFVLPYMERAGAYAIDCNVNSSDTTAYFNSYGGIIFMYGDTIACGIGSTTRNFNSFGTTYQFADSRPLASYINGSPPGPVTFHGIVPNVSGTGIGRFTGDAGWQRFVNFPDYVLKTSKPWNISVPKNGQTTTTVPVTGVIVGSHWARANMNTGLSGIQLSAYVSSANTVTVVAQNNQTTAITLNGGTLYIEAGWM